MKAILVVFFISLLVLSACAVQQQASANQSIDKASDAQAKTKATGTASSKTGTAKVTGKATATVSGKGNATKTAKTGTKTTVRRITNQTKQIVSETKPAPQPAQQQPSQPQKAEEPKVSIAVAILGKEGFDKSELTISSGSTVTWENKDKIDLTLTIFKEGVFYKNSGLIKPGEKFSAVFDEKGMFEYWTVAYGVKAVITVT